MTGVCPDPELKSRLPSPCKLSSPAHLPAAGLLREPQAAQHITNSAARALQGPRTPQDRGDPDSALPSAHRASDRPPPRLGNSQEHHPAPLRKSSCKQPIHTQQTGNSGICCVSRIQINLMGMEPCWCDCEVTAKPVNVLDEGHIHLQCPFPGGFLSMSSINAGTPETERELVPLLSPLLKQSCLFTKHPLWEEEGI